MTFFKSIFTPELRSGIVVAIMTAFLLASFGAQAEDKFPKITPELYDKLNAVDSGMDMDWPHDPAVPDMPPMPVTDDPKMNQDAFLWTHFDDNVYEPRVKGLPTPRTRIVTESDPLEVDVYWSMRSPYSYLVLDRLVWLNSNYNVNVNIRPVLPVAVRSTKGGSGKAGGLFGLPYKVPDTIHDAPRQGKYLGIPFNFPVPDPVWQVWNPGSYVPGPENWLFTHPPEKQPYIFWLTRLACYASQQGKAIDFVNQVSYLIWSGVVHPDNPNAADDYSKGHWPNYVKEYMNRVDGLDHDEAIAYIRKNPEKIDQCWIDNAEGMARTGHGGVPLMVIQDEPFFGGDRFDQFVYRLRQNGLTRRHAPRPPFGTKPLRWPAGE
jgi:2-hydroxychromene-2-carboxylate isomerase